MGMEDPIPTFSYLISTIKRLYPDLLYLHLIEPNIAGSGDPEASRGIESNQVFCDLWAPKPVIAAGGFSKETAIKAAEDGRLVAFGRYYIANVRLSLFLWIADCNTKWLPTWNIAGFTVTIEIKHRFDSLQPCHVLHWRGSGI
jgi:NADPH2 dehydrogenase